MSGMTQDEIATKLGMSSRNLRDVLKRLDLDHKENSFDEILLAYIEHLRSVASGREATSVNEAKIIAETRKHSAMADKLERELAKEEGLLLESEQVALCMREWIGRTKAAFTNAIENLVESIESQHSIVVDHEYADKLTADTLRAVADYRFKSTESG